MSNIGTSARYDGRDLAIQYDNDAGSSTATTARFPAEQFTDEFPGADSLPGRCEPTRTGSTSENEVMFLADALHPNDNTESMSLGGSGPGARRLAFRAGYQNLFQEDSEIGLTLGAGVHGGVGDNRFQFDYAWADSRDDWKRRIG